MDENKKIDLEAKAEITKPYTVKSNDRIFGFRAGDKVFLTEKQAQRYLEQDLIVLNADQQARMDELDRIANAKQEALLQQDHEKVAELDAEAANVERGEDGKFVSKAKENAKK